ncbi:F-box/LRR-repeat protein 3, partial [Orussus abietinus]|uniref:F-box/LRR-repeat protein 3 n=1 Tax=Orussus abietinus TaxID=222816 RepID=UPI000C7160C4
MVKGDGADGDVLRDDSKDRETRDMAADGDDGTGPRARLTAAATSTEKPETTCGPRKGEAPSQTTKGNNCKLVSRPLEGPQDENGGPCWGNLPSVILLEVFSYLPHESRIAASQVCKNWRYALFHPTFWKKITFTLKDEDNISWARFLANCFGLSVREATIRCDSPGRCVGEALWILKKLSSNTHLRKLFLEPSSCAFEWTCRREDNKDEGRQICTRIMEALLDIVENSNQLEALGFGCAEDLMANAGAILEQLQNYHAKHLTHLSLASVKEDPDHYALLELDCSAFRSFVRLSVLTIDYDYVSDTLLKALDNGTMERLVIHVHGLEEDHPGTTNSAWLLFRQKNPRCELRLNLVHSYVAVTVLDSDILRPAMPLTHLKVLFCENVNVGALHRLSGWYPDSLKSLIWIDSLDQSQYLPPTHDPDEPD